MKNRILPASFILLLFCSNYLYAQPTICIPYGTPPAIDGIVLPGEWDDADSAVITIASNQVVTVKIKHDSLNLYVAYLNNLESAFRFPEISIDVNNDKSASWQIDDWWFHVSATDCESNGSPNNYSNCLTVQPGWEAEPNMVTGFPNTDTIEIKIPFVKIGILLPSNNTIGLLFDVSNTSTIWNYWPAGADINNPSTWATAYFCTPSVGLSDRALQNSINIFPNPSAGNFSISSDEIINNGIVRVYTLYGNEIYTENISNELNKEIEIKNLSPGIYLVKLFTKNNYYCKKIIIE